MPGTLSCKKDATFNNVNILGKLNVNQSVRDEIIFSNYMNDVVDLNFSENIHQLKHNRTIFFRKPL